MELPRLVIPNSVIERMSKFFPNFPDISKEEYAKLVSKTEVSIQEINTIHAFKSADALALVDGKIPAKSFYYISNQYNWINGYLKNNTEGYERAVKHLKDVDAFYLMKYKDHYDEWWIDRENRVPLLEWDRELSDRLLNKYSTKGSRKGGASVFD